MNKKVYAKLEFDKILAMLAGKTLSDPGREAALSLRPKKSLEAVAQLQSETLDAEGVLMRQSATPMSGFSDIAAETARLRAGADLTCAELLRVLGVMKAARRAKNGIDKSEHGANLLYRIAQPLFFRRPADSAAG